MKKLQSLATAGAVALTALVLVACGGGKKTATTTTSTGDNSVKIVSGTYIIPQDADAANGYKYLALNLSVKNNGIKENFYSSSFSLKSKDGSKIKTEYVDDSDDETFKGMDNEKLDKGEKGKGYVVFKVKPKTKYTLEFEPYGDSGKDVKKSELKVNTGKYLDQTADGQKALKAYIDNVFMGLNDKDYDTLVANDLDAERKTYATEVRSYLEKDVVDDPLTDSAFTKMLSQLQAANVKAGAAKYQVEYAYPTKVKIEVTPTVYSLTDMSSEISDLTSELMKKDTSDKYDYDQLERMAKEYFVASFDKVLADLKPTSSDYGNDIELVKTDGKWKIDTSSDDYETFAEPFTGDQY